MEEDLNQGTFFYDLNFLKTYQDLILLSGEDDQSQLIICPRWQARVMTSSAEGNKGISLGWINYDLIKSKKIQRHINVFGGEDRFWLGPEGGQYSIFFKKGSPFDIEHWQTPSSIDTEEFEVIEKNKTRASFTKKIELENYQGTKFNLLVQRDVHIFSRKEIIEALDADPENLKSVGFESINKVTNINETAWTKSSGLLSIWILGMFPASEHTNVVIPYKKSEGKIVTEDYFGKLSADRLSIQPKAIYFLGDARFKSKIGIAQKNAKSLFGSYDVDRKVLTIITYSLPEKPQEYVNSLWQTQQFPYMGDVINAFNDGPSAEGAKGLGNFYELETSSPAMELNPKESLTHTHSTFHFYGDDKKLNELSQKVLGVSLSEIKDAFKMKE
jgi:hypothetical protein